MAPTAEVPVALVSEQPVGIDPTFGEFVASVRVVLEVELALRLERLAKHADGVAGRSTEANVDRSVRALAQGRAELGECPEQGRGPILGVAVGIRIGFGQREDRPAGGEEPGSLLG